MIKFNNRFHGHASLGYVYKKGQVERSRLISVKYIKNDRRKNSRFAVVVSKKVLKSAVKRNKVRRRIYECLRLRTPKMNGIYDIAVIVLNAEILSITPKELNVQIDQLLAGCY